MEPSLIPSLCPGKPEAWMRSLYTARQLWWRPLPRYTGGSGGPGLYHTVAPVTLEHDLPPVLDLPDVGPVLVQPHVADEKDLAMLDEAREGTVHCNDRSD